MAIRFMLDTDNLADLTAHAELLATYSDLVTDVPSLQKKFPQSVLVFIDRGLGDPGNKATVLDVERGALTIAQAVAEYDRKHAAGITELTGYVNRSNLAAFDAAFGTRNIYRWVATLDGTAHIQGFKSLFGPAVIQCLNSTELGYHADGNLVLQDQWHRTLDVANTAPIVAGIADARRHLAAITDDLMRMAAVIGG